MRLPQIEIAVLERAVADLFRAAGVVQADALCVAEDLVAADVEGIASHGIMLVPMYLDLIKAGSVRPAADRTGGGGGAGCGEHAGPAHGAAGRGAGRGKG